LVYAAGPDVPMTYLSRVTPDQLRQQLEQDAVAFYNLRYPAVKSLRETRGRVVAVSTTATSRVIVRDVLSAAPKGAVQAVVKLLAVEEGRFGIRANCVGVGMTTDSLGAKLSESEGLDERALEAAKANIPLRRFGSAQDVAEAVCFLASDRAAFISGQALNVDGGYSA
jgi:3-oxoacyl-[acyl-carrier protein] reductase